MVLLPTVKVMAPEADPDVTAVPLTFTVAPVTATVGVTVMDDVALVTDAV